MTTSCLRLGCLLGVLSSALAAPGVAGAPQFQVSGSQFRLVPIARGAPKSNAPQLRDGVGYSTNWAGYAAESNLSEPTLGAITAVTGTWIVPAASGGANSRTAAYSSAWVGIDGYEDAQLSALFSGLSPQQQKQMLLATQTVEQIGTEQDWTGKAASYYAWFEFYPNYAYEIEGFTVKPGDSITGSVSYLGANKWATRLTNNTRNLAVTVTATFSADRYSAEWIVEAPSGASGPLPLADFGSVQLSGCTATINGKTVPIGAASWESLDMVNSADTALTAETSPLNAAGNAFSVQWLAE